MTPARITELLTPFHLVLDEARLHQISIYIDLLLRWNARINLTAIRRPEEIVSRHFGESLFAARYLFPATGHVRAEAVPKHLKEIPICPNTGHAATLSRLIDVGSGPGFPGLPIKIWHPSLHLTLIESNQKKATFLREVIRTLTLTNVNVFSARAETHPQACAEVVTLRAVEKFDSALPAAAALVAPAGRLALLIASPQVGQSLHLVTTFKWNKPVPIPTFQSRVLLIATKVPR